MRLCLKLCIWHSSRCNAQLSGSNTTASACQCVSCIPNCAMLICLGPSCGKISLCAHSQCTSSSKCMKKPHLQLLTGAALLHRYIQSTCATSGEGLYEGLDWLSSNIANKA